MVPIFFPLGVKLYLPSIQNETFTETGYNLVPFFFFFAAFTRADLGYMNPKGFNHMFLCGGGVPSYDENRIR